MNKIVFFIFIMFFSTSIFSQEMESDLKLDSSPEKKTHQKEPVIEKKTFEYRGFLRYLTHAQRQNASSNSNIFSSNQQAQLETLFQLNTWQIKAAVQSNLSFSSTDNHLIFQSQWASKERNAVIPGLYREIGHNWLWSTRFRHFFLKYTAESLIFSVGKQIISWGEGRFLNPLNLISPASPFAFDLDDIQGSDLVYLGYFFSATDSLEFVIQPLQENNYEDPNQLKIENTNTFFRYKGSIKKLDIALTGAYHYHSWLLGLENNLTIWDASFRFSGLLRREPEMNDYITYGSPKKSYWTVQTVFGIGYAFFKGKMRTNLEFFYNSNPYSSNNLLEKYIIYEESIISGINSPLPEDSSYFYTKGRILTKNPVFIQASVGYSPNGEIDLNCFIMLDPKGSSSFQLLSLKYSVAENVDWLLGFHFFILPSHTGKAEFEDAYNQVYSYLKWYF